MSNQGKIFIISGPSGVGKDTIIKGILKKYPDFIMVPSYTTRPPRKSNEVGNRIFVTKKEFKDMIKAGEMIEWQKVHNHYYGRKLDDIVRHINNGKNVIMDVNVDGTLEYKNKTMQNLINKTRNHAEKQYSNVITIFIKYEKPELFESRLKINRPEITDEELQIRKEGFKREMTFEKYYDYLIINYENHVEKAIEQIVKIINNCK
jgi:guanylate kinase